MCFSFEFVPCFCGSLPGSLKMSFLLFFNFSEKLYVGILFIKVIVESINFVFMYGSECLANRA